MKGITPFLIPGDLVVVLPSEDLGRVWQYNEGLGMCTIRLGSQWTEDDIGVWLSQFGHLDVLSDDREYEHVDDDGDPHAALEHERADANQKFCEDVIPVTYIEVSDSRVIVMHAADNLNRHLIYAQLQRVSEDLFAERSRNSTNTDLVVTVDDPDLLAYEALEQHVLQHLCRGTPLDEVDLSDRDISDCFVRALCGIFYPVSQPSRGAGLAARWRRAAAVFQRASKSRSLLSAIETFVSSESAVHPVASGVVVDIIDIHSNMVRAIPLNLLCWVRKLDVSSNPLSPDSFTNLWQSDDDCPSKQVLQSSSLEVLLMRNCALPVSAIWAFLAFLHSNGEVFPCLLWIDFADNCVVDRHIIIEASRAVACHPTICTLDLAPPSDMLQDGAWLDEDGWTAFFSLRDLLQRNAERLSTDAVLKLSAASSASDVALHPQCRNILNNLACWEVWNKNQKDLLMRDQEKMTMHPTPIASGAAVSDNRIMDELDETFETFEIVSDRCAGVSSSIPQAVFPGGPGGSGMKLAVGRIAARLSQRLTCYSSEVVEQCAICLDRFGISEMYILDACCHRFCRSCLSGYVRTCVRDADLGSLRCPLPSCNCRKDLLSDKDIADCLGGRQSDLWHRFEAIRLQQALQAIPGLVWCPRPYCGNAVVLPTVGNDPAATSTGSASTSASASETRLVVTPHPAMSVTCNACKLEFCARCRGAWHEGYSCEQYAQWAQQNAEADARFFEWAAQNEAKPCPRCRQFISKNGGCNHMTCTGCKYEFCWLCGQKYTPGHFSSGHCVQFDTAD